MAQDFEILRAKDVLRMTIQKEEVHRLEVFGRAIQKEEVVEDEQPRNTGILRLRHSR